MRRTNALHGVVAGVLVASLFAATLIGTAQARMGDDCDYTSRSHAHYGFLNGPVAKRLALTDDQREKIDAIMRTQRSDTENRMTQLRDIRKELRDYVTSSSFNPAHAKELADQQAAVMSELTVKRVTAFNQAYALLTDDQKKKLAEWKDDRDHRHDGYDGHRGWEDDAP